MDRLAAARTAVIVLGAALLGSRALSADELLLKNGGRLTGVIVERTATTITIETSPGRVTLPLSRVEEVSDARSSLQVWRERAASLGPNDSEGWAALARWAEDQQLQTQAREAWRHVLSLDPSHPEANAAVDADREVPAERATAWERDDESARQRLDAAARAREAEDRARDAEARAREAAAAAAEAAAAQSGGIPLWMTAGSAYGPETRGWDRRPHEGHGPRHGSPAPVVTTPPSVPPSSLGPTAAPPNGAHGGVSAGRSETATLSSRGQEGR